MCPSVSTTGSNSALPGFKTPSLCSRLIPSTFDCNRADTILERFIILIGAVMKPAMIRRKTVFLDLEDTIIDDFYSCLLINVERVQQFMMDEKPDALGVFSHALANEKDLQTARKNIFPALERLFRLSIEPSLTPTVDELVAIIAKQKHFHPEAFSTDEFFDFFGKRESFEGFVMSRQDLRGTECVLLDDSVDNIEIHHFDSDTLIRYICVNT